MEKLTTTNAISEDNYPDIGGRRLLFEIDDFEIKHLSEFRTAVKEIEDLKCPLNSAFLLRFLRAKKYNIKAAVKLVEAYFTLRLQNGSTMTTLFTVHEKFFDSKTAVVLRNRTEDGAKIMFFRIKNWNPKEVDAEEMLAASFLIYEEMTMIDETQKQGIVVIFDATGVTLSHTKDLIMAMSIKQTIKMISFFQGTFPAKFKGIYGVNLPYAFKAVYASVKYFLKPKLRNRIHISSSGPERLHSHISPDILPDCLGGILTIEEAEDTSFVEAAMKNISYQEDLQNSFGYTS